MQKQIIKDYFTFSRAERRGIIFLLAVIVVILAVRIIYPQIKRNSKTATSEFIAEADKWFNSAFTITPDSSLFEFNKVENEPDLRLFYFNPNTITDAEIRSLNINARIKNSWIKYLQSGGRFYKKEDFKKIYGIDSATYQRLEPYISLEDDAPENEIGLFQRIPEVMAPLEINSATQAEFEKLYGIGPVLAQRIIKYRKILGGFSDISQLSEVYGLNDSILRLNFNKLSVNKTLVVKIDINKADYSTLAKHPYIPDYHAKAILSYRKSRGNILSLQDLKNNHLLPDSVLQKATDYLVFNE